MAADEEAIIRVADDALYRAKNQGRNCTVFLAAQSSQGEASTTP